MSLKKSMFALFLTAAGIQGAVAAGPIQIYANGTNITEMSYGVSISNPVVSLAYSAPTMSTCIIEIIQRPFSGGSAPFLYVGPYPNTGVFNNVQFPSSPPAQYQTMVSCYGNNQPNTTATAWIMVY